MSRSPGTTFVALVLLALVPAGRSFGQAGPAPAAETAPPAAPGPDLALLRGLLGRARQAWQEQNHADARTQIASAIEQALAGPGATEDAAAIALVEELGTFADDAGELSWAEKARRRVLEVRARSLPDDHPDLQAAQMNLAWTMFKLRDFSGARSLEEKVLEIRTRTLPDDHPDLQLVRTSLGSTLHMLGDLQGARVLHEKVLEVLSRTLPDAHSYLQVARSKLAQTLYALGDLQGARVLQEKLLEIRTRTLLDDHPDLQATRSDLAKMLMTLGDLQAARALLEKVLEVRTRTLPDEHRDLQITRLGLANVMYKLGDLQGARSMAEGVLEVFSRTLPDDHPDLQEARQSVANTLFSLGDLEGTRLLEEQVLEARARTLPDDHPWLQAARADFANTLAMLGDLQGARALLEKALEIRSRTLPDEHPTLQWMRQNLAALITELGDLQSARALNEKVLEVYSRTLPDDHPHLQQVRGNLANTIRQLGDLQRARALEEKVLAINSRTLPDDHPDLQASRSNLANTLKQLGDLVDARVLEEKVLSVNSRTLPDDHPSLQLSRHNLAATLAGQSAQRAGGMEGEDVRLREEARERCTELILALCQAQTHAVRIALLASPSREAEDRCTRLAERLDAVLSFARGCGVFERSPGLEAPAFVLSESARGAAIASAGLARKAAGVPTYAGLREALVQAGEELAALAQQGTTHDAFDAARVKRERAERELIALAREVLGPESGGVDLEVSGLSRRLGEHAASVSFRRFEDWRWDVEQESGANGTSTRHAVTTQRLCAFVVRGEAAASAAEDASERLTLVDLGPIEPIEAAVHAWRDGIGVAAGRGVSVAPSPALEDLQASGDRLRRLVFDPLLPAIGKCERILLEPDDVLHLVAFDALPLADGQDLVGDRWQIETRATLGELWSEESLREGEPTLLAIGGVRYDAGPPEATVTTAETATASAPESITAAPRVQAAGILRGGAWSQGFAELPATADEAQGIAAAFAEAFTSGASATVLDQAAATRQRMLELAPRARFLHVATHGWFAPESIPSWSDSRPIDGSSGLATRPSGEEQVRGMSPMLLCGLALAGANQPENAVGRAPGLVTADELAALDLSRCELAVLSACDTNVGERRAGQGVASLQRALQMAGARTVITSLWKVPDEATRDLMLDFYRRIWVEKTPKGRALWAAKTKLRETKDEQGQPVYSTRDWAAWVLTGDPD